MIELEFKIGNQEPYSKEFFTTFETDCYIANLDFEHDPDNVTISGLDATNYELEKPIVMDDARLLEIVKAIPQDADKSKRYQFDLQLEFIDKIVSVVFDYEDKWRVCYIKTDDGEEFEDSAYILADAVRILFDGGTCVLLDDNLNEYMIENNAIWYDKWKREDMSVLNRVWGAIF